MTKREVTTDSIEGKPVVSVVIPSYNSVEHIGQCLLSIRACTTKLPFEVIVVDSSADGADQIVAKEFPAVRLFHFAEQVVVGRARNVGVKEARGEVILFVDTDCRVKPTWIDQMYIALQESGADAICGSVENGTPWSISGCIGFYLEFFRFLAYNGKPSKSTFLIGCNSGFRKEIFKTAQYYDHYSHERVGEDFIFTWLLAKKSKHLLFLPSVSLKHINKTGLMKVLRYQYKIGLGAASYRSMTSPGIVSVIKSLPILTFFMPVATIGWIGSTVFKRRGLLEFLKFVSLLPLLYLANNVWAMGFYQGLKSESKSNTQMKKS